MYTGVCGLPQKSDIWYILHINMTGAFIVSCNFQTYVIFTSTTCRKPTYNVI